MSRDMGGQVSAGARYAVADAERFTVTMHNDGVEQSVDVANGEGVEADFDNGTLRRLSDAENAELREPTE